VRYLHKVLAQAGTTYSQLLCRIRLERAAQMLSDRRFNELPVAEIAWRSGFQDPGHFSKRFRGAFGRTPGSFRTSAQ
jgi:AraC-like DNA-binding protein